VPVTDPPLPQPDLLETDLLPGIPYYIMVWAGPYVGTTVMNDREAQPGATIDLGDVKIRARLTKR